MSASPLDRAKINQLVTDIGKAGLNALYPNEFEYYAITLELTDSNGVTVDYLTFPISPDNIDSSSVPLTNIKKTMGGIVALGSATFVPLKISLGGTFGRKLKILVQPSSINSSESTNSGSYGRDAQFNVTSAVFNSKIKTGYGTIKLLESIIDKSRTLDKQGQPYRMFLYNPALGQNYLVVDGGLDFHQDYQSSNMVWKYTLQLTAISPLNAIMSEMSNSSSLTRTLKLNILQKSANLAANIIKRTVL